MSSGLTGLEGSTAAPRTQFASMVDLLRCRAAEQPNDRAYVFLSERGGEAAVVTYAELLGRAHAVAVKLAEHARPGERALLLFAPGLDFYVAFFACLLAGVIAVPMMVPRRSSSRDASEQILADCTPRLILTNSGLAASRPDVVERFQGAGIV